jgi:hypothetical protein
MTAVRLIRSFPHLLKEHCCGGCLFGRRGTVTAAGALQEHVVLCMRAAATKNDATGPACQWALAHSFEVMNSAAEFS